MAPTVLPKLPAPHAEFVKYLAANVDKTMTELVEPYRKFEAQLREVYAQEPDHEALKDPHVNVVPIFAGDTDKILTRARDLEKETDKEKESYIMALPQDKRRPDGSPAVVQSLRDFQHNFSVFSESSLIDLDWNNVVAAGSSVVNTLLPVPKEYKTSKRALREYYHEKFCPASDVDLFLYGLTEEEALEKITQIESRIRDSILTETTTVRTKNAITICSQYPTRHVQIVLRIYKSVSEILTGFDIDCSGAAYDGENVYCTPRALQSYMTQINHIDLTRRSPSYENRLSKYSHRNFEVYWPEIDRSRIDPTIYERSFMRTLGLARLLVLERLPNRTEREQYLNKRREERGRPALNSNFYRRLHGNIKENHEDEIADWVDADEVSNYHTFTVPYGVKFHAKKIEKLCYTKDLLLNAEWNQPKDRKVYLHRHPAFFGRAKDCFADCCGSCPTPTTPEEVEAADEESKIYVSGKISFLQDDPGRQQIGSFNPLTENDWTEMAYVGNTARLCQAIVDGDLEHVEDWLSQEGADPNKRDFTGRTPLHLAVMSSTAPIVQCLVDHGARLVARLADGKTALHLAATRGDAEIVKILLEKSTANEEEEGEKMDRRRAAKLAAGLEPTPEKSDEEDEKVLKDDDEDEDEDKDGDEDSEDAELIEGEDESDEDQQSMATGSFVKVKNGAQPAEHADTIPDTDDSEPDFYSKDVTAWDVPCSALHLAIVAGHTEIVRLLCEEFAVCDVLNPVKFMSTEGKPNAALLTLALSLTLPEEKAQEMTKTLLSLGATSAQADLNGITAFHRFVAEGTHALVETLWTTDAAAVKVAINHLALQGSSWNPIPSNPLMTAIGAGDRKIITKLLESGAKAKIDFESWIKSAKQNPSFQGYLNNVDANMRMFNKTEQPILRAIKTAWPGIAVELLKHGADPNTMPGEAYDALTSQYRYYKGETILDIVRKELKSLREYKEEKPTLVKPTLRPGLSEYLKTVEPRTYMHWMVSADIQQIRKNHDQSLKTYNESLAREQAKVSAHLAKGKKKQVDADETTGHEEKMREIKSVISQLEEVEAAIIEAGGKTFKDLHPDVTGAENNNTYNSSYGSPADNKPGPYKYDFKVYGKNDVTPAQSEAYAELFEAAWSGDLDKIKSLTLTSWDEDQKEAPLKIAVYDAMHNNPFALAFLRGHLDAAQAVLEIVQAQYTPEEKEDARYRMADEVDSYDDEDESYDEESDSESADPRLRKEVIDKQFTIDNIGQVSLQVESHVKVVDVLGWVVPTFTVNKDGTVKTLTMAATPLIQFTVETDNQSALKFLLDLAVSFTAKSATDDGESNKSFTFPDGAFRVAVEQGRIEILTEIIKRAGAGMPLEHIVSQSGVKMEVKQKYYQGLLVYGKRRHDWAAAGRNTIVKPTGSKTAPLLMAAKAGNLQSVEWFLTDIPLARYQEYGQSKAGKDDARLRHLNKIPGGFDRAISKWLTMQNDMVLHCVVLGPQKDDTTKLIDYLIKVYPATLETKSRQGHTPLYLACMLGRVDYASTLIKAGADVTTRAPVALCNIAHGALTHLPTSPQLRALFDLLDRDLVAQLLSQRTRLSADGKTPLHQFAQSYATFKKQPRYYYHSVTTTPYDCHPEEAAKVLALLLDYLPSAGDVSGSSSAGSDPGLDADVQLQRGRVLEMLNGAGDTVLHELVRAEWPAGIRVVLDRNPALLYRENAVGRTPLEVAQARLEATKFAVPNWPSLNGRPSQRTGPGGEKQTRPTQFHEILGAAPFVFVDNDGEGDDDSEEADQETADKHKATAEAIGAGPQAVWDVVAEYAAKFPGKRKLVSLNEANDVARRLGETYAKSRYFTAPKKKEDGDDDEGEEEGEGEKKKEDATEDEQDKNDVVSQTLSAGMAKMAWNGKEGDCELCGKKHSLRGWE